MSTPPPGSSGGQNVVYKRLWQFQSGWPEKYDCLFTRYQDFKIKQSDSPRKGVTLVKFEILSKLVNLN